MLLFHLFESIKNVRRSLVRTIVKCHVDVGASGHLELGSFAQGNVTVDVLRKVTLALDSVPEKSGRAGSFIGTTVGTVVVTAAALGVRPVTVVRTLEDRQDTGYRQQVEPS